jgi:response regulator RpfG family c-di-GMP phosphodiesterase
MSETATVPPATPTLLFVDDEPGILSSLRRLFRPHGYRILVAESGAVGLAILEKEAVDLVISDMRMPEMDGATFLKAARQRWPQVMRILLTGYADITSTVAAINEGEIYRYITKPWDDNEILIVVRQAIERQHLEGENQRLTALTLAQNEALKALNASLEQKVAERTAELRQALTLVEQAHGELKKTFLTSVQVFVGLVELRSGPAGSPMAGHGRRVAEHARSVAQRLGLADSDVQNVMLAGLLHDIGKLGLPDELLAKSYNTLSAEQRALVMKHPVIGQNILMSIDKLKDSALLVRHHHECFDGSGFPEHLAGIAIPQGSRILSVVNEFDALQIGTLVQRPLKPGEALNFLIENRGKRYDPTVVDAFVRLLAETHKTEIGEIPLRTMHLKPGMLLARDLTHREGYMLLARGATLSSEIIAQLMRMEQAEQHSLTLYIRQEEK